jgi:uncharacterized alpha-E superfamily protein
MLSRVADELSWMGRYLERAENLTRLLLVTEDLWTEIRGFNEKLAVSEWSDLLTIFPGADVDEARPVKGRGAAPVEAVAREHLSTFFGGALNTYSVAFSLRKARENARAVREVLTLEVFLSLNETYRALESRIPRDFPDLPAARAALSATQAGLLGIAGAIEQTLSRDEGWTFLKLGEALERVTRTTAILRAKLPALLVPPPQTEIPLYYSQWRSLLRSLSSLENYRKLHGARMEPSLIISFVVADPHAPRSLRFGAEAVKRHLEEIAGVAALTPPARLIGQLHSRLCYSEPPEPSAGARLLAFLDEVQSGLSMTHDAVEALYFGG